MSAESLMNDAKDHLLKMMLYTSALLEVSDDENVQDIAHRIGIRIGAAMYQIQTLKGISDSGFRPPNYDEIINQAKELEAEEQADLLIGDVIEATKKNNFRKCLQGLINAVQ